MAFQHVSKDRNLREYRMLDKKITFPDLSQYARNGRGRGELADGSLMTLTTNSSKIYSEDWAFSSVLLVFDLAALVSGSDATDATQTHAPKYPK